MKLILKRDIKNLGVRDEVVQVADGYARNYLIPRGLAVEATGANLKALQVRKNRQAALKEEEQRKSQRLAEKLSGLQLKIVSKAGEGGRLFGSVTNKDIADALQKEYNLRIDKKKIELDEPIKAIGSFQVMIKVDAERQVLITVQVVEANRERG